MMFYITDSSLTSVCLCHLLCAACFRLAYIHIDRALHVDILPAGKLVRSQMI